MVFNRHLVASRSRGSRTVDWSERCAAGPLHGPSGAARALAGLDAITWHTRVAASTMAAPYDPAEPEPIPDFEFDQSPPDDFDL